MPLITWEDGLTLGVAEIDQQHERIIRIVNRLEDATREGRAAEILSDILDELIIHTVTHFSTEEKYFAQFGYPDADAHKKEHAALIEKVNTFANDFNKRPAHGRFALARELLDFLKIWFSCHVLETDIKFVKLFRENMR